MRRKLIEADLLECVLGLGPNLFYNSPMEACIVICRASKPADRQGKVLFIDAVKAVSRQQAQTLLKPEHQERILAAYEAFTDEPGFASVASIEDILRRSGSLSIPLYVKKLTSDDADAHIATTWAAFEETGVLFWQEMVQLADGLDGEFLKKILHAYVLGNMTQLQEALSERADLPRRWASVTEDSDWTIWLTPSEVRALMERLTATIREVADAAPRDREHAPEGCEQYTLQLHGFPRPRRLVPEHRVMNRQA